MALHRQVQLAALRIAVPGPQRRRQLGNRRRIAPRQQRPGREGLGIEIDHPVDGDAADGEVRILHGAVSAAARAGAAGGIGCGAGAATTATDGAA